MRKRSQFPALRWISIVLLVGAVILTAFQLVRFSRIRSTYSANMTIAGIPVGNLDRTQVAERLLQVYSTPVELIYGQAVIQMKPSVAGFELNTESMLAAADIQRSNKSFWAGFWDYLWNRPEAAADIPLSAKISEERLRSYLINEIAARYDQPPVAAIPVAGSINFEKGQSGLTLDIDRAVVLISDALRSPTQRQVNLTFQVTSPPRPSFENLKILIQQIMDLANYDGLAEIYLYDLQTLEELHFAYQQGNYLSTQPDIAFTAASTIKIPVMVSAFRRIKEPITPEIEDLIELMIERSENGPTDTLMQRLISPERGPLEVTKDMQALGLTNTFLAGYFYVGAPLLQKFSTPANQRTDVFTDPDIYNQTTALDMGMLLEDIYQCSLNGGGALAAVFPGDFTQSKCQSMITYLARNKIAVLLQAGVPEGTQIAHKHGWVTSLDGVIHSIADTGIVYTPGGNYILCVFLYHPVQLVWEPVNNMVTKISSAIYNYYNLPTQ